MSEGDLNVLFVVHYLLWILISKHLLKPFVNYFLLKYLNKCWCFIYLFFNEKNYHFFINDQNHLFHFFPTLSLCKCCLHTSTHQSLSNLSSSVRSTLFIVGQIPKAISLENRVAALSQNGILTYRIDEFYFSWYFGFILSTFGLISL